MQDKPDKAQAAQLAETPKQQMRIVSFYGDWICECGRQNRLWDHCQCTQVVPCRDWVRGRCKYMDQCRSVPCPPGHHVFCSGACCKIYHLNQSSILDWIGLSTQRWATHGLATYLTARTPVGGTRLAHY